MWRKLTYGPEAAFQPLAAEGHPLEYKKRLLFALGADEEMLRKAANSDNVKSLIYICSSRTTGIDNVDTAGRSASMMTSERGYLESIEVLRFCANTLIRTDRGMLLSYGAAHADAVFCIWSREAFPFLDHFK